MLYIIPVALLMTVYSGTALVSAAAVSAAALPLAPGPPHAAIVAAAAMHVENKMTFFIFFPLF